MPEKIMLRSREAIPAYAGLSNGIELEIEDGKEWYGHSYGTCVGMVHDDGAVESYFKNDKEAGTTRIFDALMKDIGLFKKHVELMDRETGKKKSGDRYFVLYDVTGHSSAEPTVTDAYVDGCSNVKYLVEYEIVLAAGDGLKRYVTVEYGTKGSGALSVYAHAAMLEDEFDGWFEEGSHGFSVDKKDGVRYVMFYDDTGEGVPIEIYDVSELLSMVCSIRTIRCEEKIVD